MKTTTVEQLLEFLNEKVLSFSYVLTPSENCLCYHKIYSMSLQKDMAICCLDKQLEVRNYAEKDGKASLPLGQDSSQPHFYVNLKIMSTICELSNSWQIICLLNVFSCVPIQDYFSMTAFYPLTTRLLIYAFQKFVKCHIS